MGIKVGLELDDEQKRLYQATASDKGATYHHDTDAHRAREVWAASFGDMLMQTVPTGSTIRQIYEVKDARTKRDMIFMIEPNDVTAWVAPSVGTFAKNYIEADMVFVPVTQFASSVYYSLDMANDADFDVPSFALQKLNDSLLRLEEQQGWMLIRVAVNNAPASQKITIEDGTPGAGYFSKQLFNAMAIYFERSGKPLDAIYVPATAMGDIRTWVAPSIDPTTQRQIFENAGLTRIYNVTLIPIPLIHYYKSIEDKKARRKSILDRLFSPTDLLEDGSPVWNSTFKTKYADGNLDVCYGISYANFGIYAIREDIQTVNDPTAIMQWEQGILARFRAGFAIIDYENIIMGIVDREADETP